MLPSVQLNYLAVLMAAVAAFVIGGLWYSPLLFAKAWVKAHAYSPEQVAAMQAAAPKAYSVTLVCQLAIAAAMGVIVYYMRLVRAEQGVQLGLLAWGGFAAPLGLVGHVYSGKRLAAWLIDAGYQLTYLVAMGVILAVWR
jgi:hypothetical protein